MLPIIGDAGRWPGFLMGAHASGVPSIVRPLVALHVTWAISRRKMVCKICFELPIQNLTFHR
jgi:hypothetical protein